MTKIDKLTDQIPKAYQKQYTKALTGKASPRQAIKIFCLQCVGFVRNEVAQCTAKNCPLYKYRPFQSKI